MEKIFKQDTISLAKDLLGKLILVKKNNEILGGYIVETEAYLGVEDRACHGFEGKLTPKVEALFGKAGTGKTRLARQYAEQYDLNYFITGSIRDPFQQYNLEHVIILDELRPHQFDYSDLLKMFDPYNVKSMASSRYFDKPLLANIYIITSPYSPYDFFLELTKKRKTSHIDSWGQLMRRLSLVVEVKKEHLQFYKYEPMDQMFYIDHSNKLPNPFKNQTDREETIQDKSYQLFLELNKKKERNE